MIRRTFIAALILFLQVQASAQKITTADLKKLKAKEDSLAAYAENLVMDSLTENRMRSDSLFVRTLIRSLQIKNSFYYPFDSVLGISKLYAPDSAFRIISWVLSFDDYYSRQRAAIQMRTPDGSFKIHPLYDVSEESMNVMDSTRTKLRWIGAVYYNMVATEYRGKKYYTLFGNDNNSVMSNKKWAEVLHFSDKGDPLFGGPFFSFANDSIPRPVQHRFQLEYKEDARIILTYDPELQMIVFDHLIPEDGEPEKKWTYIPDGDYEGFQWKNGQWVHVEKIFHFKLEDGQAPVEKPLFKSGGNK